MGTPAAHPALGLLDLLSPHLLAPGGQKSTAAPSVLQPGYCIRKGKKSQSCPPFTQTPGRVFLEHGSSHIPAALVTELRSLLALRTDTSKLGQGRRICIVSSHPRFAHLGLCSVSAQPNRSNTNSTARGGDAQPGSCPVHSWGDLTRERTVLHRHCPTESQAGRTTALPEELLSLPTGPPTPTLLGKSQGKQQTSEHHIPHHTSYSLSQERYFHPPPLQRAGKLWEGQYFEVTTQKSKSKPTKRSPADLPVPPAARMYPGQSSRCGLGAKGPHPA